VSTSAISHQIRGLEELLGTRLLERSTGLGGIAVTAAGSRLLPATTDALLLLEDACLEIRNGTKLLTVSANGPFSSLWLALRMAIYSARHPETPIKSVILEGPPDFARHPVDIAIVHVPEREMLPGDVVLLQEEVFPVCSPALKERSTTALFQSQLLQQEHRDFPEVDWCNWAGELNLGDRFESRIVRYSSFIQVIGAAIGGAGVALGRSPLVQSELDSGRLVRVFPQLARIASWRYVIRLSTVRKHRMADNLVRHLRADAASC
jgi:LysR family transcriptional regulator, glycine cleavage system transcriptional activator